MISYGGSKYNVSVLVDTQYKNEALKGLNLGLFDL
jgi:aspartate kinase